MLTGNPVTAFPALLFLGSACAAIFISGRLPRWLGFVVAAAAALQAVAWISFFAPAGILAAGALSDIVSFGAFLAWVSLCSLTMLATWRRSP